MVKRNNVIIMLVVIVIMFDTPYKNVFNVYASPILIMKKENFFLISIYKLFRH